RNQKAPARHGPPAWLWVLFALMLGAFVSVLWYLWDRRPAEPVATEPEIRTPAAPTRKAPVANAPASPANGPGEEPRFDFYTILPQAEVLPNRRTAEAASAAANRVPASAEADRTSYLLQAGSFRSEQEADRRRAQVLLLGLPVKTLKVAVSPGEERFRVVVGPFKGKEAAEAARASLRANGVDTLTLKQ
ncbi:MAG: SPOR domain-containing protein, partial [Moraxellaceae bacterium]